MTNLEFEEMIRELQALRAGVKMAEFADHIEELIENQIDEVDEYEIDELRSQILSLENELETKDYEISDLEDEIKDLNRELRALSEKLEEAWE